MAEVTELVEAVLRHEALFLELEHTGPFGGGHVTASPIQLVDGEVQCVVAKLEIPDIDALHRTDTSCDGERCERSEGRPPASTIRR